MIEIMPQNMINHYYQLKESQKNHIISQIIYQIKFISYILSKVNIILHKKVIDKYDKFKKFRTFLDYIQSNIDSFNEKTKKIINKFQLNLFNPSDITLIFGTPMWNQSAKEQITKYIKKDLNVKMIT